MDIKQLQRKMKEVKRRLDPKEIEREKNLQHAKGIVKGAAVGSVVAGVAALFLSPDSGKNNRKKAKEELEKAKDVLEANLVEGKEKLSQIYDNQKELIEEKKNLLKEKFSVEEDLNILDELDFEEIEEALDSDEY